MKKFDLVYADPPWQYSFSRSKNRRVENQYSTMSLRDIMDIDVVSICNDDCVLYLWSTAPKLREALATMVAWGFEYKTNAVWVKDKIGMGYWWRGRHELLLVGTRGKVSPPLPEKRLDSVLSYPRSRHSKKPNEVRDVIGFLFEDKRKVELFARDKYPGWTCWGDEVNGCSLEDLVT